MASGLFSASREKGKLPSEDGQESARVAAVAMVKHAGPLVEARFLRREKRFLIQVENDQGVFWAHSNNTGSMLGLLRPGRTVWLSRHDNPKRRFQHTLEAVLAPDFATIVPVGVNTLTPNRMLRAAVAARALPEALGHDGFAAEPGFEGGRLDALLSGPEGNIWVETKNVTLVEDGLALFPDAPTERGRKHLRELTRLAREGRARAALFFLVQRPDGACFAPAGMIDPDYARLFAEAVAAGVEVWAWRGEVGPEGVRLGPRLPLAGEW